MNQTMNAEISRLVDAISAADAVMVGAGSGLSAAAGFTYSGKRFQAYFADFIETYGFSDMYSAGFYPFKTLEEQWAYWSRHIWYNRYVEAPKDTYDKLLQLLTARISSSSQRMLTTASSSQDSPRNVCSTPRATTACGNAVFLVMIQPMTISRPWHA